MNKLLLLSFLLISCSQPDYKNPHILIATTHGNIEVELFPDQAPKTVTAFLSYIDSGYYQNASFYRVLKTEDYPMKNNPGIIQGGIWQTNPRIKIKIPGIEHESTKLTGLSHLSGTISLARTTPGTANTEFFICIGDQSSIDAGGADTDDGEGYAAFGNVFKGMDVVKRIQSQNSYGDKFDNPIAILKISRL